MAISPSSLSLGAPQPSSDPRQELQKAAEQMESMFVNMMVQAMRKTVPKAETPSHAETIFQSMSDDHLVQELVKSKNIGLSDQLMDYWMTLYHLDEPKSSEKLR